MTEHIEPCDTIKSVASQVSELTMRFKNMSSWVRWTGTSIIVIVGAILAFLIETDARTVDNLNEHKMNAIMHRTEREMRERDQREAEWQEFIKSEFRELKRGQTAIRGKQK
jgi:hypothetical protein